MEKKYRYVMMIAIGISVFAVNGLMGTVYSSLTDYKFNKDEAYSTMEYLYMGLTSDTEDGGPGAIDGSFAKFKQEYPNDVEMRKRATTDALNIVVAEYMNGTRSTDFFVRKIEYQWLDPTFGARKTILINETGNGEPDHTELFYSFYHSELRNIVFKLLNIYMVFIYMFALFAGACTLFQKREIDIHFFIHIYVMGGFVFQLLWESLSRYCLPYYLWLIPEALYGVSILANRISIRKKVS